MTTQELINEKLHNKKKSNCFVYLISRFGQPIQWDKEGRELDWKVRIELLKTPDDQADRKFDFEFKWGEDHIPWADLMLTAMSRGMFEEGSTVFEMSHPKFGRTEFAVADLVVGEVAREFNYTEPDVIVESRMDWQMFTAFFRLYALNKQSFRKSMSQIKNKTKPTSKKEVLKDWDYQA